MVRLSRFLCFLAVVAASLHIIAQAVEHVEFAGRRTSSRDSDGFVHHTAHIQQGSKLHKLEYHVKPAGDEKVVKIPDAKSTVAHCSSHFVMLRVTHLSQSLTDRITRGVVLVGGHGAGCVSSQTQRSIPLLKKVLEITAHDENFMHLVVSDASYSEVFQHGNITYSQHHAKALPKVVKAPKHVLSREQQLQEAIPELPTDEDLNPRRASSGHARGLTSSSGTISAMEPWTGTSVNSSQPLLISWKSSGVPAGKNVTLSVYITQTLVDTFIGKWSVVSQGDGIQSTYITVGSVSLWTPNQEYYVKYSCSVCSSSVQGNLFSVNYLPLSAMTNPTSQSSYVMGQDTAIQVNWVVDSAHLSYSCTLYLYISVPWFFDTEVSSQSCHMSDLNGSIAMPSKFGGSWTESSYYYAKVEYDCTLGLFCKKLYSQFFSVSSNESNLEIGVVSPTTGLYFYSGNIMNISWSSNAADIGVSDASITVTLKQDGWATATVWATFYQNLSNQALAFTVPAGLPDGTNYFVQIDWDCTGVHGACHSAQSRRFSINHTPVATFSLPVFQTVYAPGASVQASWAWNSNAISSVLVQVEQDPSFSTSLFPVNKQSLSNSPTSASATFSTGYILPLVWKLYYNCKIAGWFCNYEASPQFYVSDTQQQSKSGDLVLFNTSNKIAPCLECGIVTVEDEISVTYSVANTAMISMFEIYIADFSIVALRYNVSGTVSASVDLLLKLHLAYEFELPDIPLYAISAEPSFDVAEIDVDVGAEFGLFFRTTIEISAAGTLSTGMDATWNYAIVHQRGSIYPQQISEALVNRTSFNKHPLELDLDAEVTVKFGPALIASASLELFETGAKLEGDVFLFSELGGTFTYPANAALTSTTVPSTVLGTFGNCYVPHYLEYHWDLGAEATLKGILLIEVFGPYTYTIFDIEMFFGCAVTASTPQTFAMTVANVNSTNASALGALMETDFASYLATDQTNINVQYSTSYQVSLLNGDATAASTLCNALATSSSQIYTSQYPTVQGLAGQITVSCGTV